MKTTPIACPSCAKPLPVPRPKSETRITCPHDNCGAEVFVPTRSSKAYKEGLVLLASEQECAIRLVAALERFMLSRSRGEPFEESVNEVLSQNEDDVYILTFAERAKELLFAYRLLIRSRNFLYLQQKQNRLDLGWTTETFATQLVLRFLKDPWWKYQLKSFLMIENKITAEALKMWSERRRIYQRDDAQRQQTTTTYISHGGVTDVGINLPVGPN